jgi:DAACS family dicarboxylate/amino acid:cation (Na+ or H+) symporter
MTHAAPMSLSTDRGRWRMPLHFRILVGLLVGAALGVLAHLACDRPPLAAGPDGQVQADPLDLDSNRLDDRLDGFLANFADPAGRVFLRLMLMVVVPLVFAALALGVVELGDVRRLGRVGLMTLAMTLAFSLTAVAVGITLVNVVRPGGQLSQADRDVLRKQYARGAEDTVQKAAKAKSLRDTLLDVIPENPLQEAAGALDGSSKGNGMLAVMFFSLIFGAAITMAPARTEALVRVLEGVFDASMVIIGLAMKLAPYCVALLTFSLAARLGLGVFATLGWFVGTVLVGLTFQLVVVYSVAVAAVGGRSPLTFFRDVSEAMITAFATSSSNATLPTALRVAEEKLALPREVSRFVLTVGATGNQNGTALYEGVVVLFLAQVFGVELTVWQQVTVVLMSVLAGVGTAGVPGGSLPLIVLVLVSVGVPGDGIAIILGIDRLLDMCRTVLNVTGDLALATCVSRWERSPSAA